MAKQFPASRVKLQCLKAFSNGTINGELPDRLKVFNWGVNKTTKGEFIVDDTTLQVFEATQKAMGRETLVIDFNHCTIPGHPAYGGATAPTAGYGQARVVKGEGIFVEGISTTATGRKLSPDYVDISPAPLTVDNRIIGMDSIALTQTGSVEGLTLELAAQEGRRQGLQTLSAALETDYTKSDPTAYRLANTTTYNGLMEKHLEYFREQLGLAAGTSAEDIMTAIRAKWEGDEKVTGPLDDAAPGASQTTPVWDARVEVEKMVASLTKPLADQIVTLSAELRAARDNDETRRKTLDADERAAIIAAATRDGKVIPFSADILPTIPTAALKDCVAKLPKTIATQSRIVTLSADGKAANAPRPTLKDAARAIEANLRYN
jgi:hypothetical protein